MLEGDNHDSALVASNSYPQLQGVFHYYDPQRRVAGQVADSIGGHDKSAWDFYVFYSEKDVWTDAAPAPLTWLHQLGTDDWAGADHYRWGPALRTALENGLEQLQGLRAA